MSGLQNSIDNLSQIQRRRLLYRETRRPLFNEVLVMELLMNIDEPHKGVRDGESYFPSPFVSTLQTSKIYSHYDTPGHIDRVHELVCKMDGPVEVEEGKLDSWLRLGLENSHLVNCFFNFQGPQKEVLVHALRKHHDHIGFNLVPYKVIVEYAGAKDMGFMLKWLQNNAPLMPNSDKKNPWFTLFYPSMPLDKEVLKECIRQGLDINALHEISARTMNTPCLQGFTAPMESTGEPPKLYCSLLAHAYIMGCANTTHMSLACGADPNAVVFRVGETGSPERHEFRFKEWMDITAWPGDKDLRSRTEDVLCSLERSSQANDLLRELIPIAEGLSSARKPSI